MGLELGLGQGLDSNVKLSRFLMLSIVTFFPLFTKLLQARWRRASLNDGKSRFHPSSLYTDTFVGSSHPPVMITSLLSGSEMAQAALT